MYTLTVRGTTGPEADITAVRLYLGSGAAVEVAAGPSSTFTTSMQYPTSGNVALAYSYVDSAGNESGRHSQTMFIPDKEAPAAPGTDLQVVSVVWA